MPVVSTRSFCEGLVAPLVAYHQTDNLQWSWSPGISLPDRFAPISPALRWARDGAVPLVRSVLPKFGLNSNRNTNRAIATLLRKGLIVRTRAARPKHAALYGVSHFALNADAMKKAGAWDPRVTPSHTGADISVPQVDPEPTYYGTESARETPHSVPPWVRVNSTSAADSVPAVDTSKNLPCPQVGTNPLPAHLTFLMTRITAHGGTVAATTDLRVRWCRGDPPVDLAGDLKIHSTELLHCLRASTGAPPFNGASDAQPLAACRMAA
jgi:hypothetical protein